MANLNACSYAGAFEGDVLTTFVIATCEASIYDTANGQIPWMKKFLDVANVF